MIKFVGDVAWREKNQGKIQYIAFEGSKVVQIDEQIKEGSREAAL